ncbi:MAG TPA: hypothetical protein PK121_01220 [Candidatus Pacearchaeota archaeon]|nr:hypothetical protein [Candidatus Pacearchaeota archaeon]
MNAPKVKFTDMPLSREIYFMHSFLFEDNWNWKKYIIKKHPKIKKVFSFKSKEEKINFLKNYILEVKKENQKLIKQNKRKYQKDWEKIEKIFFITLSEILEINWPKNRKVIKAMMSINPICPRFLNEWSFSIFYNYKKISYAREVIMHECCHFLYFEKWKKVFPKTNHRKFETPYLEWHLSEIIAPIILNDLRIQKILNHKADFYEEYQNIKIENKTVPEYFNNLYNKTIKEKNFTEFLKEAYKEIKKNKELFKI